MKVPYKINLPYKNGKIVGLIKEDGLPFRDCDGNIEYIRKESLQEWAKEKISRLEDTTGGDAGDYTTGYIHALMDLIDKINSR